MGMGKAMEVLFMPVGLGGMGIGDNPLSEKKEKSGSGVNAMEMPQPPSVSDATEKAESMVQRKKAAATRSVYTSPLGLEGEAKVARKYLLGQ